MKKPHDPVASAVETLAAPRWDQEPDWHTFKEKLVNEPKPRFQFARRRPYLFAGLATALLCAGAAAVVTVYQRAYFRGTIVLDDGTEAQVEGEVLMDSNTTWVTAEGTAGAASSGSGQAQFVTEDGRTVNVNIISEGQGEKPKEGAPAEKKEEPKAPATPK